jgi:hypothetical protein
VEDATKAYENAANKLPKNEDLLVGVWQCYVRRGDYQKQKEV